MRIICGLLSSALLFGTALAAEPHAVSFTMQASQQSLRDKARNDTFASTVDAPGWANSRFDVECSAGTAGLWGIGFTRRDETCKVTGKTMLVNPTNHAQQILRINYSGGFVTKPDGYTDARTILANYQKVGTAAAENASFGGSVMMKPENPAASAKALQERLIGYLQEQGGAQGGVSISTEMDTIRFDRFMVPNVGGRGTVDCAWTGDMLYAYANEAWQMDFTVKCGEQTYKLEGNMPWLDVEGQDHQAEYVLNLMTGGGGGAAGGDPFAAADPFAQIDGISGTIKMELSDLVEVRISETETDEVPVSVTAKGTLTGTNVPPDLTYSFAQILAIFARTMFGA
ncbi:hypothetical protein [Propylenella binzhouense]|uniref:Uncharacterized protein n=1 Tax=Propylenella binzhouense TaxID=2555902 RepID=A0A964T7J3_9HYPH|nr:hypothetical protein [Propylenella binzhouense]MYZ49991.1 hypothetical protein [Propylenella binzhouense]